MLNTTVSIVVKRGFEGRRDIPAWVLADLMLNAYNATEIEEFREPLMEGLHPGHR